MVCLRRVSIHQVSNHVLAVGARFEELRALPSEVIFSSPRKMPRLIELFCGTKSISKVFEQHGWTCTSLDFDPKMEPTICCNILDVTPEMILEHGRPDVIWASPLCTMYSRARTTAKTPRDLEGSDKLVQKVIDLARYFISTSLSLWRTLTAVF